MAEKIGPQDGPHSWSGGVKPFSIGGRLVRERERLHGMTNEERLYRAQYLKDQILSHTEPRYVPEYWEQRLNPIRRFYRYPLDRVGEALIPVIGKAPAEFARYMIGKAGIFIGLAYAARYYWKYNSNDWTRRSGWALMENRDINYPGEVGFPLKRTKTKPQDFCEKGFSQSPI